jgi:hypothetical protein
MRASLTLIVLLVIAGCESYEGTAKRNEASGNVIITALTKYHAATGGYPSTLNALVPKYLPSIPPLSHADGTWLYQVDSDGSFLGYIGDGRHWSGDYHSAGGKWDYDDK